MTIFYCCRRVEGLGRLQRFRVPFECWMAGRGLVGTLKQLETEARSLSQWTFGTGQAELQDARDHHEESGIR